MTFPAIALPTLRLSEEDAELARALESQLSGFELSNRVKLAYYEGRQRVEQLGISIPPRLRNLNVVVGWAGTAVDVIEERLDWFGWRGDDSLGLSEIYAENDLDVESGLAHLDALIYGTSFAIVGRGAETDVPLVTVHSPMTTTGLWDPYRRRLSAAMSVVRDESGQAAQVTLYKPDETVHLAGDSE